jgi:hypothetical protein
MSKLDHDISNRAKQIMSHLFCFIETLYNIPPGFQQHFLLCVGIYQRGRLHPYQPETSVTLRSFRPGPNFHDSAIRCASGSPFLAGTGGRSRVAHQDHNLSQAFTRRHKKGTIFFPTKPELNLDRKKTYLLHPKEKRVGITKENTVEQL